MMNVAVVGGGWYGCHIARKLLESGHSVHLFERGSGLFYGASGKNQSRLHLGFHYPRDAVTRDRSIAEARPFLREYGHLTRAIRTNVYAVASGVSLIDYRTYRTIVEGSGAQFVELQPGDFDIKNVDGAMLTGERLILEDRAAQEFRNKIFESVGSGWREMSFNHEVTDLKELAREFDWVIDCTFGSFDIHAVEWFEPCAMALYRGDDDFALTVMDGPEGTSLYPYYKPGQVSLTTVEHTPLRRCDSMAMARSTIERFFESTAWQEQVRCDMEERMMRYLPRIREEYTPDGWACSVRVKPISGSDRRAIVVTPNEERKIITVFPGKITGIFDAWEVVRGACETD